jgi:hypothetical protein
MVWVIAFELFVAIVAGIVFALLWHRKLVGGLNELKRQNQLLQGIEARISESGRALLKARESSSTLTEKERASWD